MTKTFVTQGSRGLEKAKKEEGQSRCMSMRTHLSSS
jgi:hypothetical protein